MEKEKCLLVVFSLEVSNSVFNITKQNNSFASHLPLSWGDNENIKKVKK